MYQVSVVRRLVLLAFGPLAIACARPTSGQPGPDVGRTSAEVGVFNAAVGFRLAWLGDSTRIAACQAFSVLREPADFQTNVFEVYRRLLDADVSTCRGAGSKAPGARNLVLLDSLALSDSTADLYMTVRRGENQHKQHYRMHRTQLGSRAIWSVAAVRLYDVMRSR